ncbi:MAG: dUTP diphosphatase [Armatimonadetes bacterium]|nr:dUTP diphosphatase [Armatimonadota bacterium]
MQKIRIEVLELPGLTLPEYATPNSAGVDLRAAESYTLAPMERKLVSTGLKIAIPEGFEGQVRPRSGLALKHGIGMVNTPGTIDSDYRGEIGVLLINLGSEPFEILTGERIGQLVFSPVVQAEFVVVEALESTDRGEGGFGSTGKT